MTCPRCEGKVTVTDNVHNPNTNETYRQRQCTKCGRIFYTIEFEVEANQDFKRLWNGNHRVKGGNRIK